jgi:hypothetical protein
VLLLIGIANTTKFSSTFHVKQISSSQMGAAFFVHKYLYSNLVSHETLKKV